MRRLMLAIGTCALLAQHIAGAQAPPAQNQAPSPVRPTDPSPKLPVRRVILYKNGIGYFEHLGRIRGAQAVTIDFNSSQLNDVLKSLTALDLGDGRITNISYNSEAPFAQRLGALRLPVGQQTTLAQFLGALRGAPIEVHSGGQTITGRLLSVERRLRGRGNDADTRDEITVVTPAGEMRLIELTPAVSVKLAERDSVDQVGQYLGLLASTRAQDQRRMVISTAGTGERDLLVSYVSEVPIWKTTYRIVLAPAAGGKTLLQGWAIVDNTVGEDWNGVELSLVAGAPQSFIQQISQPTYAERPVVSLPTGVLRAPQTHQATMTAGIGGVRGRVQDPDGSALPGVTVRVLDEKGSEVLGVVTEESGRYSIKGLPAGAYRLQFTLEGFRTASANVAIEGGTETEQNATLRVADLSESITVTAETPSLETSSAASSTVVESIDDATVAARRGRFQASAHGQELGDLFEYRVKEPITIRKNESALVPIVGAEVGVQRVSLWNDGTGARPLRSLWLTNSSGLTLDGGSFAVLENSAFAGEGLVESLQPGEKRLLSYAVDLGVQVTALQGDQRDEITRIRIAHGVAVQQSEQRSERVYTIRDNDNTARTVLIEHPIRPGWTLAANLQPAETSASAYRFLVAVDAKKDAALKVVEIHPLEAKYVIGQLDDNQLAVFIRGARESKALAQALTPILAQKAAISALAADIAARQAEVNRIGQDQARVRENMKSLKGTPEEQQLVKRYAAQLNQQEDRLDALRRQVADIAQQSQRAQAELAKMLDSLSLDLEVPKP